MISDSLENKILNWLRSNEIIIEENQLDNFIAAFTHPSYTSFGLASNANDFERLEFLGDAVLGLASAHILLTQLSGSEGVLTEARKKLVNNKTLSKLFDKLEIIELVRIVKDGELSARIKASFVEAFFGALFLEFGYDKSKEIWEKFKKYIEKDQNIQLITSDRAKLDSDNLIDINRELGIGIKNAKSVLQEYCQKRGLETPKYEVIKKEGLEHRPIFYVKVLCSKSKSDPSEQEIAYGKSSKKKTAEIKAAEALCDKLQLKYYSD